jgi:hypothetical protein
MRNILLIMLVVVAGYMISCDKHDRLPTISTPTSIFSASSVAHERDSINTLGDTVKLSAIGLISDTSRKYAISATIQLLDSNSKVISGNYYKTITSLVKFDTVGWYKTSMYRWTISNTTGKPAIFYVNTPSIPAGNKIKTTATYTYGLNLSTQLGTLTVSDGNTMVSKKP